MGGSVRVCVCVCLDAAFVNSTLVYRVLRATIRDVNVMFVWPSLCVVLAVLCVVVAGRQAGRM